LKIEKNIFFAFIPSLKSVAFCKSLGKNSNISPLEKIGVISAADINRFLMDIIKADLVKINKSIELGNKQHKNNIPFLNKNVDWFLKEFVKIWLEINEDPKEYDIC